MELDGTVLNGACALSSCGQVSASSEQFPRWYKLYTRASLVGTACRLNEMKSVGAELQARPFAFPPFSGPGRRAAARRPQQSRSKYRPRWEGAVGEEAVVVAQERRQASRGWL